MYLKLLLFLCHLEMLNKPCVAWVRNWWTPPQSANKHKFWVILDEIYHITDNGSLYILDESILELLYDFLLKVDNISTIRVRASSQRLLIYIFSRGSPNGPLCPLVWLYLIFLLWPEPQWVLKINRKKYTTPQIRVSMPKTISFLRILKYSTISLLNLSWIL